jgi:pimeloyl-ACP methyl ester carboxylesterase
VSVIGWSLGGIYARQLARRSPDAVRQVITLGSPIRLERHQQSNARRLFHHYADRHIERWAGPLPVPATCVYSRLDGVVAWRACLDQPSPRAENVEVRASHLGFGHHPAVLWLVADRLAQPRDAWTPFLPPRFTGLAYPRPSATRDPVRAPPSTTSSPKCD